MIFTAAYSFSEVGLPDVSTKNQWRITVKGLISYEKCYCAPCTHAMVTDGDFLMLLSA